ncbi:MAG TPA: 3-methyl-2-oxobutanoate hydroxymethyltransferase [bacterium]|nr:3-methyl-2-oxobutanoate hydroxymethyltransferase [bacterium]
MFTLTDLQAKKKAGEKISVLTCYDYAMAKILSSAGIDMLLVGDSLGMVVLGYDTTRQVTMADMLRHTEAVVRGNTAALVIADMPYGSYDSPASAVANARAFLDIGAHMVKVERGSEIAPVIKALVSADIPVMGHLGLTPQTAANFKVQGREVEAAVKIRTDARLLEQLGVRSLVLESIPAQLAGEITSSLRIPTIGIGAGSDTDGQVLVLYDMLGLFDDFSPKFVKKYAQLADRIRQAVTSYSADVRAGKFPDASHSYL